MDKHERARLVAKKTEVVSPISCGVTWVDGRVVFKRGKNHSKFWYGICHFSRGVCLASPHDYKDPLMITSIRVSPTEKWCERSFTCLNTKCHLNLFDRNVFVKEFGGVGAFSLSIPHNLKDKPPWFTEGKWKGFWEQFISTPEGIRVEFDETKADKLGI